MAEELNTNTSAGASPLRPVQYRMFGYFQKRVDNTKATYNKGRFFRFKYMGGDFDLPVSNREVWNNPPEMFQAIWIRGYLFSNRYGELSPEIEDFIEPNEKYPVPNDNEQLAGGYVNGLVGISKSSFTRNSGDEGYKFVLRGIGLLYSYTFDDEREFLAQPEKKLLRVEARIVPNQSYSSKTKLMRTYYSLDDVVFGSRPRQDHSTPRPAGRQAPANKES